MTPPAAIGSALALAIGLTAGVSAPGGAQTDHDAVIRWATAAKPPLRTTKPEGSTRDLDALLRMIGPARIVALSEAVHLGAEPLEFRNRLFQALVERGGFTVIAIESGIAEGQVVHDYVNGAPGDLRAVVDTGMSWMFGVTPQNRELVEWMRARNQRGQPVRFYGFDVPGSPGNPGVRRRLQTGVDVTLAYLAGVDQAAESDLRTRLAPFLTLDPKTAVDGYAAMPAVNRNQVTAAIADLSALLERRGPTYRSLSSAEAYEWARRTAAGARQTDNWLRRLPVGWKHTPGTRPAWFTDATNVRDRGMAENIEWILEREGPKAKILVFASRFHVTTSRITDPGPADADTSIGLGQHLRARFGADVVTIGNLIGGGRWGCDKFVFPVTPPASHSVDGTFAAVGTPLYYLDHRSAPKAVRAWLDQEHPISEDPGSRVSPGRAFDLLVYFERTTPAC